MWFPSGIDPGATADTLARAAAVLLVASLAGRAFHRLRLPRISGYLLTGAALGPTGRFGSYAAPQAAGARVRVRCGARVRVRALRLVCRAAG